MMETIDKTALLQKEANADSTSFSDEPVALVGRHEELHKIIWILKNDKDMHITGAPGSGRFSLIRTAAEEVDAKILPVDCIRASDGESFIRLMLTNLYEAFGENSSNLVTKVLMKANPEEVMFYRVGSKLLLESNLSEDLLWKAFQAVVHSIQDITYEIGGRAILILKQFSHMSSWDKKGEWGNFLKMKIGKDPDVSYVILGTVAEEHSVRSKENKKDEGKIQWVELKPLPDQVIASWADRVLNNREMKFDKSSGALEKFLSVIQGHIGEADTLLRRIVLHSERGERITLSRIHEALDSIRKDFSDTFETIIFMLPSSQIQLLESFAIEPTTKPHQKEYIVKHGLSRGGTLQSALKGLKQRGLIYGAEYSHKLTLPLLSYWLQTQKSIDNR